MRTKLFFIRTGFGLGGLLFACSSSSGGSGSSGDSGTAHDSGSLSHDGGHEDGPSSQDAGHPDDAGKPADGGGGDDSATPSDAGDDATSAGDSGHEDGAKNDAGDTGSSLTCDTTVDGGGKEYTGVFLLSRATDGTTTAFSGLGDFRTRPDGGSAGCTGTKVGACCYEASASASSGAVNAGTVTVTDGTTTLATLTSPDYIASSAEDAVFKWAPGDPLKVAATGGAFDAFSLKIAAPADLADVTPNYRAALSVPTNTDFIVTWTPSAEACSRVTVGLSQGTTLPAISCTVDDAQGKVTVPKSLLGMFTGTSGTAFIERLETEEKLEANAGAGLVAADVISTTATFTH